MENKIPDGQDLKNEFFKIVHLKRELSIYLSKNELGKCNVIKKRIDNSLYNLHSKLAIVAENSSKYEQAIEQYEKAFSIKPDNIELLLNIGNVYEKLEDYVKSIEFYHKYYLLNPNNLDVIQRLMLAYMLNHDHEKALEYENIWNSLRKEVYTNGQKAF
ncbi:hypothetical protein MHK_000195 [Candidatus Magnetomorum sp. HK-1]|nr:hypothetical protein MHK_000195 [Candidatus Magnetomorum sp. HK-1]